MNADELVGDFLHEGGTVQNVGSDGQAEYPGDVRCGCSHACLTKFSKTVVRANRLSLAELEKNEKEMLVLGILVSQKFSEEVTQRGIQRNTRIAFRYKFEG